MRMSWQVLTETSVWKRLSTKHILKQVALYFYYQH